VSPSGINRLLDGGFPTLPILLALAKAGNVSVEWLSTGQEVQSNKQELVTPPSNMAVDVKGNDVDLSEFVFVLGIMSLPLQGTVHGTMKRHQCLQSVSADIGSSIT
jgi:phage repressor protein C with HTH and peptisase S24 domain